MPNFHKIFVAYCIKSSRYIFNLNKKNHRFAIKLFGSFNLFACNLEFQLSYKNISNKIKNQII